MRSSFLQHPVLASHKPPVHFGKLNEFKSGQAVWCTDLDKTFFTPTHTNVYDTAQAIGDADKLTLVYATVRNRSQVIVNSKILPEPAYTIVENGIQIYPNLPRSEEAQPLAEWEDYINSLHYDKATIVQTIQSIAQNHNLKYGPGKDIQFRNGGSDHHHKIYLKASGYIEKEAPLRETLLREIGESLEAQGVRAYILDAAHHKVPDTWVVDFLPVQKDGTPITKNAAFEFLLERHADAVNPDQILVSGDDKVDVPLMKPGRWVIAPLGHEAVKRAVFSQYLEAFSTDSPTLALAAKWTT